MKYFVLIVLSTTLLIACGGTKTQTPPNTKIAYVASRNSNTISAYSMDGTTGVLGAQTGAPVATNCSGPVELTISPSGHFLYAPCAFGNTFAAFTISQNGNLSTVPGSPFVSDSNPVAAVIDPKGKFLYVANSGSNSVTGYTIDQNTGAVTAIPGPSTAVNFAPNGLTIDPTGSFLYVSTLFGSSGDVEGFAINSSSGALAPLSGSPFASFLATAIQMHSSGKYLYVADELNAVRGFSVNVSSGALLEIAGSPFLAGNEPFGVTTDSAGKFLYAANFLTNDVSAYTVDANTGALTPVAGSPFSVGTGPSQLTVDSTGKFLYVPNWFANDIWGFAIDGTTGELTTLQGSPFGASSPAAIATH